MTDPENESLAKNVRRLFGHLSGRRKRQVVLLFLLMLLSAITETASLGAILPFLALLANPDSASTRQWLEPIFAWWQNPGDRILAMTLLFMLAALLAGAVRLVLLWATQHFVRRVGNELSTEVFRRTLYQPYSYHVSKNSSEFIGALNKVDTVVFTVMLQLMQLSAALVISVFIIATLFLISPLVALSTGIGFAVIYVGINYFTRFKLRAASQTWASAQSERVKIMQEGVGGLRDVLIDMLQPAFISQYSRIDDAFRRSQAISSFIGMAPRFVLEAFGMVLIAGLALVMASGEGGLIAVLPILGAFALGAQRLLPLMHNIFYGMTIIFSQRYSLAQVLELLDLQVDPNLLAKPEQPLAFNRDITLSNITFRYLEERQVALRGLSLTIPKGSRVGLIGKTGSGKSTVMDLMMGLLQANSGEIRIDGVLLTAETIPAWQANIAHVPQAIYLADTTIAENIAFGIPRAEVDPERVRQAAKEAELGGFVEGLPEKYATVVGERGIRLSGGQRQRIGIARALYKRAKVLVFDEATSALDAETEAAVMASIDTLGRDLTILMIAHRLSTVERCDTVIRLEKGTIAEQGPPSAILRDDPTSAAMLPRRLAAR